MARLNGLLVKSSIFSGIGKIVGVSELEKTVSVAFFESPERPAARIIEIGVELLERAQLVEETSVYCVRSETGKWQRGRYSGSNREGHEYYVVFDREDGDWFPISAMYIINLGELGVLAPQDFLAQRVCETGFFKTNRSNFIQSYIAQRKACGAVASLLSSSVELEAYQLAVVRRVLMDETKRYLLADEVGLGKTIEAGMILRELLISDPGLQVVILAPLSLIPQWKTELGTRFFLDTELETSIHIQSHEDLVDSADLGHQVDVVIIDEAHELAAKYWTNVASDKDVYERTAEICGRSKVCLLLSGTPLRGNEVNFLSMLHFLNPDAYPITVQGISGFKAEVLQREAIGGIYQALMPSNDNATLTELLDQISEIIKRDAQLNELIQLARPLVDWLGPESGEERAAIIKSVRTHLGENYRIHQRMLRNRRDDDGIESLFPGLAGIEVLRWSIEAISVEQCLEDFRQEYLEYQEATSVITKSNFIDWVGAAFSNPRLVGARARSELKRMGNRIEEYEKEVLATLVLLAEQEQEEKDFLFLTYVDEWGTRNLDGKVVVFAGNDATATHVENLLRKQYAPIDGKVLVERHDPQIDISFGAARGLEFFICDERGESGLNLHGGKKLVVHYDLPMEISRLEQRMGRLNRYSPNLVASPVECISLVPEGLSFSNCWLTILDEDVDLFNRSAASLQYALEPYVAGVWQALVDKGLSAFEEMSVLFSGKDGLVDQERIKVRAQENLNNLDEEIAEAKRYALNIKKADLAAESQFKEMQDWIVKGLKFQREYDEDRFSFRYKYIENSTLMPVDTFKKECRLAMDLSVEDETEPVTHYMHYDRTKCANRGNIQPFRYGQPFVETIFNTLRADTRGISYAFIRELGSKNRKAPLACFGSQWLITGEGQNSIKSDSKFPPDIETVWVASEDGFSLSADQILFLNKPYYAKDKNFGYKDTNIKPATWPVLEEYFPESQWPTLVQDMYEISLQKLAESSGTLSENKATIQNLSFGVIFII